MSDTGKYCFLASQAQTQQLQHHILKLPSPSTPSPSFSQAQQTFTQACGISVFDYNINDAAPHFMKSLAATYFDFVKETIPSYFALNDRESILWQHNREKHSMDFLKVVSIAGLNQEVGSRQFSVVLQYRLGIPFFEANSSFSICARPMDIYGPTLFIVPVRWVSNLDTTWLEMHLLI